MPKHEWNWEAIKKGSIVTLKHHGTVVLRLDRKTGRFTGNKNAISESDWGGIVTTLSHYGLRDSVRREGGIRTGTVRVEKVKIPKMVA